MATTSDAAVPDHDASHPVAASFCDSLFEALGQRISGLKRAKTRGWCCFFPEGQKRFAYVKHRKKRPGLEVWFFGESSDASLYPLLQIRERKPTSPGGFAKNFKARFYLDDSKQVQPACELLASNTPPIGAALHGDESNVLHLGIRCAEELDIEGTKTEIVLLRSKRSRKLRDKAFKAANGVCCVCDRDFTKVLGGRGVRVLQVHHRDQLSARVAPSVTKIGDLAVVCANCHLLLHLDSDKALGVQKLREMLRADGGF